MIETKELAPLKAQVTKLENQASAVTITTAEEMTNSIDLVKKLKEAGSIIKEKKEAITKPLNEALKKARELFKPIEEQYETAEKILKGKILEYEAKVSEEARIAEEKIAARVDKGTLKLETAEKKIDQIERVEKTTQGAVGQGQFKIIRKVRYGELKNLTKEDLFFLVNEGYVEWNEVKARGAALNGIVIPGVEVYDEKTLAIK